MRCTLPSGGFSFEEDLTDMLADLMHLCDRHYGGPGAANFDHCLRTARMHWEEEK